MHNFNTGLLCALILMVLVSSGNGLKCWKCNDELKKDAAGPFNCNDTSKLTETPATPITEEVTAAPTSDSKKEGCYTLRVEVDAGKWRFLRGGERYEVAAGATDDKGKAKCDALVLDALKNAGNLQKTDKNHNCEFCFAEKCNTGNFAAAADGSTTTGSSVSIRANSFIYCFVIFALFIRKFLSSDLLVK